MKITNLFYFIFLCFITLTNSTQSKEINKIVVKIENEIITSYDIKNKILTNLIIANKEINQKNINIFKEKSLENLIQNRLKKIELRKYNFKRDSQRIDTYLNSISSNNIDDLRLKFKMNNINFETFVDEIDIEFKWRNLIYSAYSKKINVNQDEIKLEADKMLKNRKKIIKYNLSEIEIISSDEKSDKEKINFIKDEIENTSFEDAVVKFSVSSTSSNEGKLGWINSNSLSNDILIVLKKMNIGEISKPLKKQDRILILKLNNKKISNPSKIEVESFVKEITDQKKNELFALYSNSFLSQLRNNKFIEYYK